MELLLPKAQDCLWAFNAVGQQVPSSRLYCTEQEQDQGQDYRLVSSDSYFSNSNLDKRVLDLGGTIVGLTTMQAFIVVAVVRDFLLELQ